MKEIKYESTDYGMCLVECPYGIRNRGGIICVASTSCKNCKFNQEIDIKNNIVKCVYEKYKVMKIKEILQKYINADIDSAVKENGALYISSAFAAMEEYGRDMYNQAIEDVLELGEHHWHEACGDLLEDVNTLKKK